MTARPWTTSAGLSPRAQSEKSMLSLAPGRSRHRRGAGGLRAKTSDRSPTPAYPTAECLRRNTCTGAGNGKPARTPYPRPRCAHRQACTAATMADGATGHLESRGPPGVTSPPWRVPTTLPPAPYWRSSMWCTGSSRHTWQRSAWAWVSAS
jgi:hypothetical protein